jgi:hypothetical protein
VVGITHCAVDLRLSCRDRIAPHQRQVQTLLHQQPQLSRNTIEEGRRPTVRRTLPRRRRPWVAYVENGSRARCCAWSDAIRQRAASSSRSCAAEARSASGPTDGIYFSILTKVVACPDGSSAFISREEASRP